MLTASCVYITRMRISYFFFFNDTATTEIYTLSLHDALPISDVIDTSSLLNRCQGKGALAEKLLLKFQQQVNEHLDRKSTRLNSSHLVISYAVFCLKKKNIAYELSSNFINGRINALLIRTFRS